MREFRIELVDNGAGFPVAMLVDDQGVRRRASEAEASLWDQLQAVRRQLAEAEAKPARGKK